jgi:hypothetical protein
MQMSTLNQRAEDSVIAALLAGFWSGMLMDKLDTLTVRMNLPLLHVVAQWWPLLLIASGVTLLVQHQLANQRKPEVTRVMPVGVRSEERVHAR